jgi:hypothetical protein
VPVPFLLEFIMIITPGGAVMGFLGRLVWVKYEVSVTQLRMQAVRTEAHLEAAGHRAAVAEGTAREALTGMNRALETTRGIELVDEKVTELTRYLVDRIEGSTGQRAGRHALPAQDAPPQIGSGQPQDQEQEDKELS